MTTMVTAIDRIDAKILQVLSREGRISWRDLAERVGLSLTPTLPGIGTPSSAWPSVV